MPTATNQNIIRGQPDAKPGTDFIDLIQQILLVMTLYLGVIAANNLQAVGGLLLTGAGLSMAIDAGIRRAKGGKWFWYGTLSLIVFQAGLCLLVGSVKELSLR